MTQPQAELRTRRVENNAITYAAAHLVNYQFIGRTEGYSSPSVERAQERWHELFASLGSAAEVGLAVQLAQETERTLSIFSKHK